jgi:hypothetical protein
VFAAGGAFTTCMDELPQLLQLCLLAPRQHSWPTADCPLLSSPAAAPAAATKLSRAPTFNNLAPDLYDAAAGGTAVHVSKLQNEPQGFYQS